MRFMTRWLTVAASIGLFSCFAFPQDIPQSGPVSLRSIVEELEKAQAGVHPQTSYQVIREYRLTGGHDSSANSDVVAEVDFNPPTREDYKIQKSSGSARGQQVVRRILDHEVEAASKRSQSALNRDNYDFNYIGEEILAGQSCYVLGLNPHRKEKDLIAGRMWVDQHSFLVRQIEGELAQSPSWWVKKVHVKLTFSDLNGTWLQMSMEALADVRIIGPESLTSHILDYRSADEIALTKTNIRAQDHKR